MGRKILLVCGILSSLLYVAAVVLAPIQWEGYSSASPAFGKHFRLYSIATILLLVVGGILAGIDASRLEANLPTPWMGVTERINIYAYMLWVVVLSIALLRSQVEQFQFFLNLRYTDRA